MAPRIAVKRLSSVEIDPNRSHQHEFHATRLRRELGFGDVRTSGPLVTMIFEADDTAPLVEDSEFTLYDARERVLTRSAEWHLYYTSTAIPKHARTGDLAILYRSGPSLQAVIARQGTTVERELLEAIAVGPDAIREQFAFIDAPRPDQDEARAVAEQLTLPAGIQAAFDVADHPLFKTALADGRMPTTGHMAEAAADITRTQGRAMANPDGYLTAMLEVETELYYAIESAIHSDRLTSLIGRQPSVADIIDFAMSIQQSRRSRRGTSLQNHFARLLDREGVRYSAQCTTEPGETPDFIVPGCVAYHDSAFPSDRLRMVACKSTAKERWRQVLNEAARIPRKFLLTLDPDLTPGTIKAMASAGLQVFLPMSLLQSTYATRPLAERPRSVSDLVVELAQVGATAIHG
ncbi:MAG: type II restriction endonuclease [Actinomycetota bacterium]|nr:type II restriction endonuclease [Actinomycetota bacterium]